MCIEGSYEVSFFDELTNITKGDTVLIPSCIEEFVLPTNGRNSVGNSHP